MASNNSEAGRALGGGAFGGVIGGIAMMVFMIAMNAAKGADVSMAAKMPAFPFLGDAAMQPGFEAGAVLLGLLCHFAVSVVWGALFGYLAYGLSKGWTVVAGALWGIAVWLGMFYIVLPIVGAASIAEMMPVGTAVFEHVLFGTGVGLGFLAFQRERARVEPPRIERRIEVRT